MPSSNLPDPEKIPDMSLGERTDRPAPIARPMAETSSYSQQPVADPLRPSPSPEPSDDRTSRWKDGDDVLAPWEPNFLYPGTIKQILRDDARGDQALIAFDDGGEGWVFLYSLCPFEFKKGQQVHVRRFDGPTYYFAEVLEISGGEVRVRYDQGGTEWTKMTLLRLPCVENGPGAVATKLAPWQSPQAASTIDSTGGGGVPSWVIWVGIMILLAFVRIGCRAAMQN